MKPISEIDKTPISFQAAPLSEKHLEEFRQATRTQFSPGFPPTFPTCFRKAEFDFLERFEVDMRLLLHVDQEYHYIKPLKVGDVLTITTSVGDVKERKGMYFVTLTTDFVSGKDAKIKSNTTFVVRASA